MKDSKTQQKSIAKSTAVMSACILFSRVTGFIRTWAMAFALGNTALAASFSLANNLPNMIYELVAGGMLSAAFLPIYLQQRNNKGKEAGTLYANNLLSVTVLVLGIVAVLASIFAPQVMMTQSLFSNANDQTVQNAIFFFRFFSFQIVFYGMSAVFGGILNAEREFFWPAISSVFMNIISIITFFAYPFINENTSWGNIWLAIGITLSIAVMAVVQIPQLIKCKFKIKPYIDWHDKGLHETIKLALPAMICTCINLIALSFMNSCALNVSSNGPASVQYAWMWYQLPYAVLGVALSTAMFTEMSEATSRKDWDKFKKHLMSGLRTTWVLILPMAALVFACAYDLIGLFAVGKFETSEIQPVAELLQGWALVLPFYAAYMYLFRAYSAMKDLKTVAIANFCFTIIQVFLYMLCTGVLNESISLGLPGIPLADFVFYVLIFFVLFFILHKRLHGLAIKSLLLTILKVFIAAVAGIAAIIALYMISGMGSWTGSPVVMSLLRLCIAGLCGLIVMFIVCKLFHIPEVDAAISGLRNKIRK